MMISEKKTRCTLGICLPVYHALRLVLQASSLQVDHEHLDDLDGA